MGQGGARDYYCEECRTIIGCAMGVLNSLGHGLVEKPDEQALAVELRLKGVPFVQQPRYEVSYKGSPVGCFVPDLVAYERIVVDTKVIDHLGDAEQGQMINYLRITGLDTGLLLNFRRPRLQWRQVRL